jgi:outer membrane protein assembly factor BamE (lipoprotein component of BamABCDE complex)
MKELFISVVMGVLLLCQGCVPLHLVEGAPDEKTLSSIKVGSTSKEDIIMMLGEPARVMEKEKFFQYWWIDVRGFIGGYFGGFLGYINSLHIYFDENNVVKKVELRKSFEGPLPVDEKSKKLRSADFILELYAGKYIEMGVPNISEIELNKNGKGIWRESGKEASLKWSIVDDEIGLNTKSEVIIVQIYNDILEMPSPTGSAYRHFKRTK